MIDRHQMEKCVYVLPNFAPPNIGETLKSIAESDHAFLPADIYGQGGACEEVATRLKKMFDKPAARFCVKGMIAQMAVLRAVTEFTGNNRVVVHRASHLDYDEMEAVEILHPIQFLRAGNHHHPFTVDDLDALGEKPAAVCVELPLRRASYRLLPYAELQKKFPHGATCMMCICILMGRAYLVRRRHMAKSSVKLRCCATAFMYRFIKNLKVWAVAALLAAKR